MARAYYNPSDYGSEEVEMMRKFYIQMEDSRQYFYNFIKLVIHIINSNYFAFG